MSNKVSIVIPCYNQGKYLKEAVDSVLASTYENIEIIVINDGSTEDVEIVNDFSAPKTKVVHQENQGVCVARNNGVKLATGKYILQLDADDKINPNYIEKAVNVLDNDEKMGIVYCKAQYFDKEDGIWDLKEHSFPECLWENRIFNTARYRKADWEKAGGYKVQMQHGNEDWEYWLTLIENGAGVYRIPEILFYYRSCENTRSKLMASSSFMDRIKEIIKLHPAMYIDNLEKIIQPLAKIMMTNMPKAQLKAMYDLRIKTKLWGNKMLYILVGKE